MIPMMEFTSFDDKLTTGNIGWSLERESTEQRYPFRRQLDECSKSW
jgi:hypothetical protein